MTTLPRSAVRDVRVFVGSPLAMTVAVLFFAGAASTLAFFPRRRRRDGGAGSAPELERFMATAPRVPIIVPAEGAKVLIVKFNDFRVRPAASRIYSTQSILAKYQASHPGAVRLVLKDLSPDADCNANVIQTPPSRCVRSRCRRPPRTPAQPRGGDGGVAAYEPADHDAAAVGAPGSLATSGGITDFDAHTNRRWPAWKLDVGLGRQLESNQRRPSSSTA